MTQAFFTADWLLETITTAIPLVLVGLCTAMAFRVGFWNIGIEGQLWLGANAREREPNDGDVPLHCGVDSSTRSSCCLNSRTKEPTFNRENDWKRKERADLFKEVEELRKERSRLRAQVSAAKKRTNTPP